MWELTFKGVSQLYSRSATFDAVRILGGSCRKAFSLVDDYVAS